MVVTTNTNVVVGCHLLIGGGIASSLRCALHSAVNESVCFFCLSVVFVVAGIAVRLLLYVILLKNITLEVQALRYALCM